MSAFRDLHDRHGDVAPLEHELAVTQVQERAYQLWQAHRGVVQGAADAVAYCADVVMTGELFLVPYAQLERGNYLRWLASEKADPANGRVTPRELAGVRADAVEAFTEAQLLAPTPAFAAWATLLLGWALFEHGRFTSAREQAMAALEISPDTFSSRYAAANFARTATALSDSLQRAVARGTSL